MNKSLLLVLAALLTAGALAGCARRPATGAVEPTGTPLPAARASKRVIADGRVVPVQSADLSLPVGGVIGETFVQEGDMVTSGQLLLRLRADRQRAMLAQAEAELRRAQARYAETAAGSREQEILAAKASVDAAQAQLDKLRLGPKAEDIEASEASLAAAQAELRKASAGPDSKELIAAKAELDNADAARRRAQAAYDRVAGSPDVGRLPEALELEKATNEYNAAKARYEALQRGANPADVAAARARVDRAQAELNALKAPPSPADIAAAEAEVRRTQANLDLLLAGPRAEAIAAALADVAAAEAAVEQVKAELADTELYAPFDGEVVSLNAIIGQQVNAAEPLVRMADFSGWRIETNDLTELDVVGIQPGDPVAITFDAIPGLELPGTVLRIKPIGENKQGDITYTVIVLPDLFDERLLWNMTATVSIEPGVGRVLTPIIVPPIAQQTETAVAMLATATSPPATPVKIASAITGTEATGVEVGVASQTPFVPAVGEVITPTVALTAEVAAEGTVVVTPTLPAATQPPAATATATATATASPTATSTPSPTATATPSPTATATRTPTATAVPTRTPTPRAPRPATPTAQPTVRRPTPRPSPTPQPARAPSPPELIYPSPNLVVSGNVDFQWRPTGQLPAGAAYEVVWWNRNEDPAAARGIAPPTLETSQVANLDVLYQSNQFTAPEINWTVLIVKTDPYVRLTQPGQSKVNVMIYGAGGGGSAPAPPKPKP